MKLKIEINTLSAAFDHPSKAAECARILRKLADDLETHADQGKGISTMLPTTLHDSRGLRCGDVWTAGQ